MRTTTLLIVTVLAAAACGKKDSDKGGGGGGPPAAAAIAEVNAAVPKELADKLSFEAAVGEKDRFHLVAPKGWKAGMMPGSFKPPEGSNLGFLTDYSVSTNCDGDCAPKDWAQTTDKVEFAPLTSGGAFTVDKDEKADGHRLVVAKNSDGTAIVSAVWWKKDGSHYVYCRARLDKEAVPAIVAFEKACRLVSVSSWN